MSYERSAVVGLRSVLTFPGADPTGTNDSSAAFQAAVNALAGTGIALWVPAGTYLIKTGITMLSGLLVQGDPSATLLFDVGVGNYCLSAFQTYNGQTTIAANVSPGATTVQVTAVAVAGGPIAAGSQIMLQAGPASPLALRGETFNVKSVSGVGPFTLTLDRPILGTYLTANTAECTLVKQSPTGIIWNGNGMTMKIAAGGHALRFWEILGGVGCELHDVVLDEGAGTLGADYAASFDTYGVYNTFDRVRLYATSPQAGLVFEAQDLGVMRDCEVSGGMSVSALLLQDCCSCTIDNCAGSRASSGLIVGSDGSNLGCSSTSVIGGQFYSNTNYGVQVEQGSTDTNLSGTFAKYNGNAGLYLSAAGTASARTRFSACDFGSNVVGILVDNTVTGTVGSAVDLSNNTGAVNGTALNAGTGTDVTLAGVVAKGLGNYGFITGGVLTMSDFEVQTSVANNYIFSNINTTGPAASTFRLVNGHVQLDGNSDIGVYQLTPGAGTCNAVMSHVKVDGAGATTIGVAPNASCTVRIGEGSDLTGTATPLDNVGGIIAMSQGEGEYNDATATGTVTLTQVQAKASCVKLTGNLSGNLTYNIPAGVAGLSYVVDASGATLNAHTLKFGPAGGEVSLTAAQHIVYSDGTNAHTVV